MTMAIGTRDNWLVFIDTNVLLDFYRLRGSNALELLNQISGHRDSLVLTRQVHMEFLKNRKNAISAALKEVTRPSMQKLPPNLRDVDEAQSMAQHLEKAAKKYREVKSRISAIINAPDEYDKVYQIVNQQFSGGGDDDIAVFDQAQKRVLLGYPPKKEKETSVGDALNWELMLRAVEESQDSPNLLIVSRDGDFGEKIESDEPIINEWLAHEFKEKFGWERKIELTERLGYALARLGEAISREIEDEEAEVLEQQDRRASTVRSIADIQQQMATFADPMKDLQEQMAAYTDPMKELQEQMAAYTDPMKEFREQMATYTDPMKEFREQMASLNDMSGLGTLSSGSNSSKKSDKRDD